MFYELQKYLNELFKRQVKLSPSREADLASNSFLYENGACKAAAIINETPHPYILRAVQKNGWLLLSLSDAAFEALIEDGRALNFAYRNDLVENRLLRFMRHGAKPCPEDETIRRVLLHTAMGRDTDAEILTMTHHKKGMERVALEKNLGGAAEAMLRFRNSQNRSSKNFVLLP
ncbi:MAG: hypothetical protein Q4C01_08025 [Clostridia bacterium]|nr:hypothetical protein [Clostridia bacterium]